MLGGRGAVVNTQREEGEEGGREEGKEKGEGEREGGTESNKKEKGGKVRS